MSAFRYQVVVQWSDIRGMYEAFIPTIMEHIHYFLPGHPTVSYGKTTEEAVNRAIWQAHSALKASKKLSILPPLEDIREIDAFIKQDKGKVRVNRSG